MAAIESVPIGTPVSAELLQQLGFTSHPLRFRTEMGPVGFCEWDTLGAIPEAAGLYAFVLMHPDWAEQRVTYVGMTSHLWMVTKGALPRGGGARAGNRYGRYRYAGATRARVNALVAGARRAECEVTHWLSARAMSSPLELAQLEEDLITRWRLRESGWNIG